MSMNFFKISVVFLAALALARVSFSAEVIELPQEELAKESVYPVFERPVSVLNRNVVTFERFDGNLFYGYAMTEPIANVNKLGFSLYYHWSEDHAVGLLLAKNFSGLSDYAKQLDKQFSLDFGRAPSPDLNAFVDYNLKLFYGKLSVTKSLVLNTSLFASGAVGIVKYSHKSYPGIAAGIGQKFYFGRQWAVRADLRLYAHEAPIPFLNGSASSPGVGTGDLKPSAGDFKERLTFTTNLDVGVSYLF